jgi:hypothetical protein
MAATKFAAHYHYADVIPPMLDEALMAKINLNHLLRALQFQAERCRGRLVHHRPAPCTGGPALRLEQHFSGIKLGSILAQLAHLTR